MYIHEIHPVITGSHDLNLISKTPLRFLCSYSCIHFFIVHGNFCHSFWSIQYIVHFIYMKLVPFPKFLHKSLVCPLHVCLGTACYVKGSQKVLDKQCSELGVEVGQTSKDGRFTVQATRCLGACGLAPVMMINDEVFGRLTPEDIPDILAKYRAS